MGTKQCRKCGKTKETTEFYPHKYNKDGFFNRCKVCERDLKKGTQKQARKSDPNRFKGYDLQKSFGISFETYNKMLTEQNGVCAICKKPETHVRLGKVTTLRVDHCHKTGKNRKLLCNMCNGGLGFFQDNPELLLTAAQYLKSHE